MAWLVLPTPFTWNWWFGSKYMAYVKLVEIWNIYDTAVSITFPVGFFISFCCVTLRFIFWKLHFYKHKPLFPEEQILLFVILFLSVRLFYLPFVSPFPLVTNTVSFFPFYCLFLLSCYFNVLGGFFPVVFLCAFSVDHTKSTEQLCPSNKGREQRGSVIGSG